MTPTRPMLLQLRVERNKPAVWLPATPGLWGYRPIITWRGTSRLDDEKLLLVRGVGPRGDDGLCVLARLDAEGNAQLIGDIKSVRELRSGVFTFYRPLTPADPTWKGAN